jgi:AraC-like DNA-binding protein
MADSLSSRVLRVGERGWLASLRSPEASLAFHPYYYGYQRIPRGLSLPMRSIDDQLMSLIVRGRGRVRTRRSEVALKPGVFFWIAPRVLHEIRSAPGLVRYTLRFRLLRGGREVRPRAAILIRESAWGLLDWMERLGRELQLGDPFSAERLPRLIALLSADAFAMNEAAPEDSARLSSARCDRLMAYVAEHLAERPSPAEMARRVGLSPDYFSRAFRRTFGTSPRTWLLRERIRHAANQLVDTTRSVKEVAFRLGYGDVYLFSRQFKQVMGLSPRSFRRRAEEPDSCRGGG